MPDSVLLHLSSFETAGVSNGIEVRVEYSIHVPSSNVINQTRFSCLQMEVVIAIKSHFIDIISVFFFACQQREIKHIERYNTYLVHMLISSFGSLSREYFNFSSILYVCDVFRCALPRLICCYSISQCQIYFAEYFEFYLNFMPITSVSSSYSAFFCIFPCRSGFPLRCLLPPLYCFN